MFSVDAIVAGAGIWGCTLARRLAEAGRRVLVIERRAVVGGNVRCETDAETGIEVHTYGSHIFHTHNPEVWSFVNRFTAFNGYQHKVLAKHAGQLYFLPIGLTLVNKFFGEELTPAELPGFMSAPERKQAIFDAFFRNYTSKQWGMDPERVDSSIIQRVPVRSTYDVNYFNDYRQGIPADGYNALFDRLLDHPNISVQCNCALGCEGERLQAAGEGADAVNRLLASRDAKCRVYYSGPVDALFGHRFGPLPWRTLRFESERVAMADVQGTAVVNYVDADVPYTRQHEFKHYHPELKEVMAAPATIICREYSSAWKPGDEPYYPVDTAESRELLGKYQAEAERLVAAGVDLVVGGRLGAYRYLDMDKAMAAALEVRI